jgi:hypothetical protein
MLDLSYVDQLTVIIQHLSPDNGFLTEHFLTFLELENHSGESVASKMMNYLSSDCKVDFCKCRGQSYNNAVNMTDRYSGMLCS